MTAPTQAPESIAITVHKVRNPAHTPLWRVVRPVLTWKLVRDGRESPLNAVHDVELSL